jgi:hypothetical protein
MSLAKDGLKFGSATDEVEDWELLLPTVVNMPKLSWRSSAVADAFDVLVLDSPDFVAGSGVDLKMLEMPLEITPGCIPRKGTSKLTLPKNRWRNVLPVVCGFGGSKIASAERRPPIECPRRTMSVFGDSWGANLKQQSV